MTDLPRSIKFTNISTSYAFICRTLEKQCGIQQQSATHEFQFVELLKILNAQEKFLISRFFSQLPTNVGSYRVLLQLQKLQILTASEYILRKEHSDQLLVDLVIFLESELELLEDLFLTAAYNSNRRMKLTAILESALGHLYAGLVSNPKISELAYVDFLPKSLPDDALSVCMNMHLNTVLQLHQVDEINEGFANFSAWINEGVDELTFVKHLSEKLLASHQQEALQFIFKYSNQENFVDWKFYLILVQSIASIAKTETQAYIKKYLKSRVLHTANTGCLKSLLHLLLTARAASASTMDIQSNLDNYAKWYKQNIGEMTYLMATEKFHLMLGLLEQSLFYEKELAYLEVHASIAISPGGRLVQAFKTKCRSQVSYLKAEAKRQSAK
ncbi:uncharacterized protein [Drosophila bipectinata]|uniref:uncharacterized protein n=1 Tax=Drosophila bipectinata TaxID=42026 RepID=UPI001C8A272F|nr:uncharacterized protein LOC108131484 [Drosophila bipectinata]